MKSFLNKSMLLGLVLALVPLGGAQAFRNVKKVSNIEFRGLNIVSKYEIMSRVDMRVVTDGILVDIDSMTKALEETALVRSFRVAEQNGALIVAVAEREPAHVFAVVRGNETIPFETDERFGVMSVRRVHSTGRPLIVIGESDIVNGALSPRVAEFAASLRAFGNADPELYGEIEEISIAESGWTQVVLRNRRTRFYIEAEAVFPPVFRHLVSYLDSKNEYPVAVRLFGALAVTR